MRPWSTIGRRNCEASLRWWFQWFFYQRHLRNILVRSWACPTVENKHASQGWWRIYSAEYSLTLGKKCFPLVHWQCLKHGEDEPSYRTFEIYRTRVRDNFREVVFWPMSLVLRLSGKDESWGTYVCRTRRVRVEEKRWDFLISIDELQTRGHLSL